MKTRHTILAVIIVVLAVLGFVAFKAWNSLDTIVEVAIETYGSEIIGADVQLEKVVLNMGAGEAALEGLHVSNPDGYKTDYAMQLDQVKVTLDIDSISAETMVIKEVMIQGPSIIYEMASGGSNIDTLANNAKKYTGVETKSEDKDDSTKLIIEDFFINDGQISVSHSILKGKSLTVGMPDIHLQDIGKESDGASPGQVAGEIMDSIKSGVGTAVASMSIGETIGSGTKAVKDGATAVMDKARGAGEKLKGMFE